MSNLTSRGPRGRCVESCGVCDPAPRLVTRNPSEVDVDTDDRGRVDRSVEIGDLRINRSMERVVNSEAKALDPLADVIGLESEVGLASGLYASEDPLILCEVDQTLGSRNVGVGPIINVGSSVQGGGPNSEHNGSDSLENITVGPDGVSQGPSCVGFKYIDEKPNLTPPDGFLWHFLSGTWTMVPAIEVEPDDDFRSSVGGKVVDRSDDQVSDRAIEETDLELDDSVTEFDFQSGLVSSPADSAIGTRKSELKKMPPSRFNEDAGFLLDPPRSAKKKGAGGDNSKVVAVGTQEKFKESVAII